MPEVSQRSLSLAELLAERDERRRRDEQAEEQLKRKRGEELTAFKKRLEDFQLTESRVGAVFDQIRHAFERGDSELMLTSFPSSFCTDQGRAVTNGSAPPITRRGKAEDLDEPDWLATMPKGARQVYDYWKTNLKPGGFKFNARVINYPGGMPGDIGLFFSWPKGGVS
jgi:hypothetical protein